MTVAIDFDGVVHWYRKGWQKGVIYDEPVPGSIEGIRTIMEVEPAFILTARMDLEDVARWISGHGIPTITQSEYKHLHGGHHPTFWGRQDVLLVTNRKLPARRYLDDRGIAFREQTGPDTGSWDQALSDLEITLEEAVETYMVTIKLPKNKAHNPLNKLTGECAVEGQFCTDKTGEHHTFLVRSAKPITFVRDYCRGRYGHVTRVELVASVPTI